MQSPDLLLVVVAFTALSTATGTEDSTVTPTDTEQPDPSWYVPGCRYYCIWKRLPYCCDDGIQEIPPDHDIHESLICPPMEEQICKKDGVYIFYIPGSEYTPIPADTPLGYTGATLLADGPPYKLPVCASDGYCLESQKCCPSRCAGRHICLLGLKNPTFLEDAQDPSLLLEDDAQDPSLLLENDNQDPLLLLEENSQDPSQGNEN